MCYKCIIDKEIGFEQIIGVDHNDIINHSHLLSEQLISLLEKIDERLMALKKITHGRKQVN